MALVRPIVVTPVRVRPISVSAIQTERNRYGGTVTDVSDTFTRADGVLGNAETGQAWEVLSGTWAVASNVATLTVDGALNKNAAVVPSGVADCTISVKWTVAGSGQRLVFRATDANNNFIVDHGGGTSLDLYRFEAASFNLLAQFAVVVANNQTVGAILSGSNIIVTLDGAPVITTSDAFQATATKHGFGAVTTTVKFDNFLITH